MHEDEIFQRMTAAFGTPAFLRRAQRVEAAWGGIRRKCVTEHKRRLAMPRLRLARLYALTESLTNSATDLCTSGDQQLLRELHDHWQPRLRVAAPAVSARSRKRAMAELTESFSRFNDLWNRFVRGIDFTAVNELREGYNKYYVIEKECALRSYKTATRDFVPLAPATGEDVFAEFPLLPVLDLMKAATK